MKRGRKPLANPKTEYVSVRIDIEHKEELLRQAAARGMSFSSYIRDLIVRHKPDPFPKAR